MTTSKICSVCQTENLPEAAQCKRCGAIFKADETLRTADLWPDEVLRKKSDLPEPPSNMIALHFIGRGKPLIFEARDKITLGRYVPGQQSPNVDLTPHHAGLMGVSRHHAMLLRMRTAYFIQDMDSTNGTWVNENHLQPNKPHQLESGDLVRLGQFVFYICFAL